LSFGIYLGFGILGFGIFLLPLPLHAQTQPASAPAPATTPAPRDDTSLAATAAQLEKQIKATKTAKHPTSDKWRFSLLPPGLSKNPQIDYAIVTEMTNAGRKLPAPSADAPVYYIAHSVGQRNIGDAYGGTKDIPYAALQAQLDSALASNGYRPVDPQHPDHTPTQVLFFAWGMHNKIDPIPTEDASPDSSSDETDADTAAADRGAADDYPANDSETTSAGMDTSPILNILSRAKTIGGKKFADEYANALADTIVARADYPLRTFAERDETTDMLVYAVSNDCYYLIVTAYDYEALRTGQKHPLPLLWVTRISTISQGVNFNATLPIMINNGAYFFGRETSPEILRKRAYKTASVNIGEATVVEYITGTSGTTAPKPATTGTTK